MEKNLDDFDTALYRLNDLTNTEQTPLPLELRQHIETLHLHSEKEYRESLIYAKFEGTEKPVKEFIEKRLSIHFTGLTAQTRMMNGLAQGITPNEESAIRKTIKSVKCLRDSYIKISKENSELFAKIEVIGTIETKNKELEERVAELERIDGENKRDIRALNSSIRNKNEALEKKSKKKTTVDEEFNRTKVELEKQIIKNKVLEEDLLKRELGRKNLLPVDDKKFVVYRDEGKKKFKTETEKIRERQDVLISQYEWKKIVRDQRDRIRQLESLDSLQSWNSGSSIDAIFMFILKICLKRRLGRYIFVGFFSCHFIFTFLLIQKLTEIS